MHCAVFFILLVVSVALAAPSKDVDHHFAHVLYSRATEEDPQKSLELDKSQVQAGLKRNGQQSPADGQVASLTSSNNFINFCMTQKIPLTNGAQVKGGSCNPTVMGRVIAENVMPSSKFVFPLNMDDSLEENKSFTVKMAVKNLQTGNFVNAESNYFAAPSQVNDKGQLIGHSHVVIQTIRSINSTDILDPTDFVFFEGLNAKAKNGLLFADVSKGLPAGTYRMGSINTAANHQPALVAVAQHGILDDVVYFTVKERQNRKDASDQSSGDSVSKTQASRGPCASKAGATIASSDE